jgi:hypothetical protein
VPARSTTSLSRARRLTARDGFSFEILSPTGGIPDFSDALNYQRAEIKAAVLARFSELGHQTTGARSVGDVQSIVWFAALHSYASFLSRAHQPIIDKIVDANLPNVGRKPTLKAAGIEARNLAEYAEAISRLVISGAVKPDKSFRSAVRKTADLPGGRRRGRLRDAGSERGRAGQPDRA